MSVLSFLREKIIMNDYEVNAFSSDEKAARPRIFRHRTNYFEEYDHIEFFNRFRLFPRIVEYLVEELEERIAHPTQRNDCLSASQQTLLALNFYENGSFLRTTGDFCGVSKSTASRVVRKVSVAIAALRPTYMKRPEGDKINEIKQEFYNIARFPWCIGALDCTCVKLQSPGGENAEVYRNRKQFFSFNVQTVADPNLKIRDIVARWPGSSHDSQIFRNSLLYASFEQGHYGDSLLVGDSGYPIKPYLITLLQEIRNEAENLFNESQIRTRNCVERQYGVWKRRFPALAMGLRLKLDTAQAIIVAIAVLHNIACDQNEKLPLVNAEQEAAVHFIDYVQVPNILNSDQMDTNNRTRFNLVNNHFTRLLNI